MTMIEAGGGFSDVDHGPLRVYGGTRGHFEMMGEYGEMG